ncbi:putative leader peptide [uncultured Jatrophihabitans sp.]
MGKGLVCMRMPVLALLTSRRAVDLCRVGSCLCPCA